MVDLAPIDEIGGRESRVPLVTWLEGGERREQRTDTPATVVAELVARLGGEPDALEVIRPSLEDVYLDLVGHEHAAGITADSLNDTVAR
jgi:ABC-2 type transport system ATP-binding protein